MPIYEFRCRVKNCSHHASPFEALRPIARRNDVIHCECGAIADRLEVPSEFPPAYFYAGGRTDAMKGKRVRIEKTTRGQRR